MLRHKELATAEMLTDQLPRVEVFTLMSVSGVDDSSDPASGCRPSHATKTDQCSEVPMLTPAELVALPKGQAFALLEEGSKSYACHCRTPARIPSCRRAWQPSPRNGADHITNDQWWRQRETWWHAVLISTCLEGTPANPQTGKRITMAETVADPRHREVRQGLLSKSVTTLAQGAVAVAGAAVLDTDRMGRHAVVVAGRGPAAQSFHVEAEIDYLDSDFPEKCLDVESGRVCQDRCGQDLHRSIRVNGLVDLIAWLAPPAPDEGGVKFWIHALLNPLPSS